MLSDAKTHIVYAPMTGSYLSVGETMFAIHLPTALHLGLPGRSGESKINC